MKARLVTIAKWVAYPAFYLFCLALFGYLTFPFERLKDRLIAEFERAQSKKGTPSGQRLEIDTVDSYWFTGVEVQGARLILPPSPDDAKGADDKAPKETVITVDDAHARVRVLPLLIGRVRVDFWASVFGGEVTGTVPVGGSGTVELQLEKIDLAKIEPITATIGLPVRGTATGELELSAADGKFNKANGTFELTVADVSGGDGKTKIKGQLALPEAKLGDLTISAEAKDGVLKVTKLAAAGDLELVGDGKVAVREPWNDSNADLYLRFKFTDAYRNKNDVTRSLLGAPGSNAPALLDLADPKIKKAKRADGFYGWHVHGPLKRLRFDPSSSDSPAAAGKRKAGDAPFTGSRKAGGIQLPLGPSEAVKDDKPVAPPPPAMAPAGDDREKEREKEHEVPAPPPPPPPPPPPTREQPPEEQPAPRQEEPAAPPQPAPEAPPAEGEQPEAPR